MLHALKSFENGGKPAEVGVAVLPVDAVKMRWVDARAQHPPEFAMLK